MSSGSDKGSATKGRQAHAAEGRPGSLRTTYVRCTACQTSFFSPLSFKTLDEFERAARAGMIAQCPNCYTIFDCNRTNMYFEVPASDAPAVVLRPLRKDASS